MAVDFWEERSTGSCILGSMRTAAQGVVGNCPADPYITIFDYYDLAEKA